MTFHRNDKIGYINEKSKNVVYLVALA